MSADWPTPVTPTFDPTDPTSFNSSMVSIAYDSLGVQHSVTQYFVKNGAGVDVHYTADGTSLTTVTKLGFGTDGQLWSVNGGTPAAPTPTPANWRPTFAPVPVSLGTPAGAKPLTVGFDYNDTTKFAGEATTTVNNTDGYASGVLIGVKLAEDGSVNAQYSNGQKQSVGMVALATFANENALEAVGNTSWSATNASGAALFFLPGVGTAGKLSVGGLEQSNVDIASELVGLMAAQRNYQANSKVISTENQMMQSLMQAL
jgi:flagellar hook protein FlgE